MFAKVLVANRGEIAVRAFRAAYELGAGTVAVFPHEDRNSVHRLKADESYEIGEPGHPVRAYLDVAAVVAAAQRAGADAVYPGYGFLSENPDLAAACAEAGITFVGPSAAVLELTGNKARAIAAAKAAGLPVLASTEPTDDVDTLLAQARDMAYPLFVKAVAGGGGRGMRKVDDEGALRGSVEAAMREAESAFGDPTVFIEQAVVNPRHIEVQILADTQGTVIHLFERDCSVQRRHQKVIELAPAPNLDPELRERMCADAVAFARAIDYTCAGTVEFLLDEARQARVHRDEPAHPGRAHGHRGGHRRRPGAGPAADRRRGVAGRPRAEPGHRAAARGGAAVPDHHRGPGQRLPPRHRPDHRLPLARRRRRPAGRRLLDGRRGGRALRLDAGQAHLPRPGLRRRRGPGPAGGGRVPDPRRGHQHPVPAGRAGRPRLPRGPGDHVVHRAAARAAHRPAVRRPRHPAADLPGRRHRQRPARRAPAPGRPDDQAARRRPGRGSPRPAPGSGCASSARRSSPPGCARSARWRSPTPRSATPTSRCWPPGCAPRTCWPSPRTWPAPPRSCCRWSAGAGRPTTSRCASCTRTRGSGWPRCARRCPTSRCRCCCAVATPSATPPTRPR